MRRRLSHRAKAGPLVVFGAGGHGLVVAEAAAACGHDILGFFDEHQRATRLGNWRIVDESELAHSTYEVIVAVGDNEARQRLCEMMQQRGRRLRSVIHPTAYVSPSAVIGQGVFIGPLAAVHAEANIGEGAIINTAAVIEHHGDIGAFAHVGPNAALGGRVTVGTQATLGVGASIRPSIQIGAGATVGAGAVVVRNVPPGVTVVGVPAEPLSQH